MTTLAARFRQQMKEVPADQQERYGQLVALLAQRFGGLDFWRLDKDWKMVQYEQVAHLILLLFNLDRPADQREEKE